MVLPFLPVESLKGHPFRSILTGKTTSLLMKRVPAMLLSLSYPKL